MRSETIEYKISIFISSKCDTERYRIVRRALKELLLETGMAIVYVFETAPGSSQPLPDTYIDHVDESHLCLFLIDNDDGVTDGVLKEYKRAEELGKKIICIFCDDGKNEPTQLEIEIKNKHSSKFSPIHDFSDFTEAAYKAALQDIVDIYKKNGKGAVLNSIENGSFEPLPVMSSTRNIIEKKLFSGIDKTKNEILSFISPSFRVEKSATELDVLLSEFLKVILCEKKFKEIDYEKLCEKVIELHKSNYKELISLRLKAIKSYYEDRINECIDFLKKALIMASQKEDIDNWISNDIAIDLRNMIEISDEINGKFTVDNEGQEYIKKNSEVVFSPVMDRLETEIYKEIIEQYYKIYTESPYSKTLGGQEVVFEEISICFYTAILYGSITNLLITRSRMISALLALFFEDNDHDLFISLIKILIIERRYSDLEKLDRIYNQSTDMVNTKDITDIQKCIECIPIMHYRIISKFILFKFFGYYFSDDQYQDFSNDLFSYSFTFIDDTNKIIALCNYVFKALKENMQRINKDRVVECLIKAFSTKNTSIYNEAFSLGSDIDYGLVSQENQVKLLKKSIEIISVIKNHSTRINNYLICFRITATIEMESMDSAVEINMEDFYNNEYQNAFTWSREFSMDRIKYYLNYIDAQNEKLTKNTGIEINYSSRYGIIINIIVKYKLDLSWDEIIPIIENVKKTLLVHNQTYREKCNAIKLIIFLKIHFNYMLEWNNFIDSLISCEEKILSGANDSFFEKDDEKNILYTTYQIMLFVFNKYSKEKVINSIMNISNLTSYGIIRCLGSINTMLEDYNYNDENDFIISYIIYLSIMLSKHKELDIRFNAVRCLIQLTHSKYNYLILPQLSSLMDTGTSKIKVSILSRVKKIADGDNSVKEYIIQKGRVDNNYWVRKIAKELNDVSADKGGEMKQQGKEGSAG